jgi:hypothetical protein
MEIWLMKATARVQAADAGEARPDLLVAATLYLMTHYMRTGCPRLALCISRHMQCLAVHGEADPKIRDICAALHGVWGEAATGVAQAPDRRDLH